MNFKKEEPRRDLALIGTCLILLIGLSLSSCSSTLFSGKSPPRAKSDVAYDFSEKAGIIFTSVCRDKALADKRRCTVTEIDIIKEWDFFKFGNFIIIPEKYVF